MMVRHPTECCRRRTELSGAAAEMERMDAQETSDMTRPDDAEGSEERTGGDVPAADDRRTMLAPRVYCGAHERH